MMRFNKLFLMLPAVAAVLAFHCAAVGGGNPQFKIALHVIPHGAACKSLPAFTDCSQIVTTYEGQGDIDVIPVLYDLNQYYVVEFGLTWPSAWGEMDYSRCVGDIAIGGITFPGDGVATSWSQCQYNSFLSHGYGWVNAAGPGMVSVIPNPATGEYCAVDCAPVQQRAKDFPIAVADAGVGGTPGDNPCQTVYLPLSLSMSDGLGGQCIARGETIAYTIAYQNSANIVQVHNVVLTDTLPAGVGFLAASAGGFYDETSRVVAWDLGTLSGGQTGSVQLSARIDAEAGATLVNACAISSEEAPGDKAATTCRVCNPEILPLELVKHDGLLDGECVYKGQNLTYSIEVSNAPNTAEVHNVVLVDHLPSPVSFVSSTGGGLYESGTRSVIWNIGTLAPGAEATRSLTVKVGTPGGAVENSCVAEGDETSMSQTTTTTSICNLGAPLLLSIGDGLGAGECAESGDTLTYLISYGNSMDNSDATAVVLTDTLATGVGFVSASLGGVYDSFANTVTWLLGTLSPSEQGSCYVKVHITASPGSLVTSKGRITCIEAAPGSASKSTNVCSLLHDLDLTNTANVPICVDHQGTVTYTLSYRNSSPTLDLHNVVLTDILPGQTAFVSATPGGVFDGDAVVRWDLGTLAAGAAGSQQVSVRVYVASGSTFTNQGRIVASEVPVPKEANRSLTVCGGSERNLNNKVAIHVMAHPTACKAVPAFTRCGDIKTTYVGSGDIDAIPVFYDLTEFTVVEFGILWPEDWGTCEFTRCKGDIALGAIVNSGDGIAVAWTQCQYSWSAAVGIAWLNAKTRGLIRPTYNPATGDIGVVNCSPSPGPYYDHPIAMAESGVNGAPGIDPCYPTKVEYTTWGAIKALFK